MDWEEERGWLNWPSGLVGGFFACVVTKTVFITAKGVWRARWIPLIVGGVVFIIMGVLSEILEIRKRKKKKIAKAVG